jgi:hypothetical protein
VLEALHDDPSLPAVTGAHMSRALDDLLDSSQAVSRTLLGVGVDPTTLPAGALAHGPGMARSGWVRASPMRMRRPFPG